MGNASTSISSISCNVDNLSRNSVTPEYWDSASISSDYSANSTAIAVILLLFLLVGLPANVVIIVSILHQKLYKEATHILLLNLAISDLLFCVLIIPINVAAGFAGGHIFGGSDYVRCQVCKTGVIFTALSVFSVNILGLISLDRFIFIKYPLRYHSLITPRRLVVVVLVTWLISIFEAILPLIGFGEVKYTYSIATCTVFLLGEFRAVKNIYYAVLLIALNLIPISVIAVTNTWIVCIVRKQIHKVYRSRKSFSNKEERRVYDKGLHKEIRKRRNKKQLALIKAFGAILIGNLIVWTPLVIHLIVVLSIPDINLIPLGMYSFVYVTVILHSIIHPLIEGIFIPDIKRTFKAVLGIGLCQKLARQRKITEVETDFDTQYSAITDDHDSEMKTSCHPYCCNVCVFTVFHHDLPES